MPQTESNITQTINQVSESGKEVLKSLDSEIVSYIQSWVNNLYTSDYGKFFAKTIFGIPLGNWIAALGVLLIIAIFRKTLAKWTLVIFQNLTKKTKTELDDIVISELKKPIRFLMIIIGFDLFFKLTFLESNKKVEFLLLTMITIDIYWILFAFTPAIKKALYNYSKNDKKLTLELSNLIIRLIRLLIIFLALINLLYNFGINITAFIASLGLVGMAFALAAKDTAANLFGSIALMVDRSIKVGEWIKVNGVEGVVEDIGMRTTKIRTFEKSFVSVPNSIVANSNIENFSRRGVRRIKMSIGLTYDTEPETISSIVDEIRYMLRSHPEIAHDQTLLVRFNKFNPSDLGIFIYTFTNTSNWREYLRIREDINLKIIEIVRRHKANFAFPSQSIYIESLPQKREALFSDIGDI